MVSEPTITDMDPVQAIDSAFCDINQQLTHLMVEVTRSSYPPPSNDYAGSFIPDVDASPLLRLEPLDVMIQQEEAYEALLETLLPNQQGMLRDAWASIRACK